MTTYINPGDLYRFQMVEMAIFDTSTLSGTYQGMNLAANYTIYTGDGLPSDIKILKVYNASNVGVTVSIDGVTDQDFWPAGATLIVDLQTNHADNSAYGAGTLNGAKGLVFYGKGSSGMGNVYIIGYR